MWLTTCAGSSFLHSSPSLQEDVGSLLMHLFEPAVDSWASRSFELSTLLLAVIQQPFMEALWNFAGPSKEALEWRPCAPKFRGKYWIYIYFPNSLLCGRKEKITNTHSHSRTHLCFTSESVRFGTASYLPVGKLCCSIAFSVGLKLTSLFIFAWQVICGASLRLLVSAIITVNLWSVWPYGIISLVILEKLCPQQATAIIANFELHSFPALVVLHYITCFAQMVHSSQKIWQQLWILDGNNNR